MSREYIVSYFKFYAYKFHYYYYYYYYFVAVFVTCKGALFQIRAKQ